MALTKYPEGSLRELTTLSIPLMIASFSTMAMIFVDRLLLANYSTAAMAATVNASTLGWAFLFGWFVLANICEVFVAQYNGAKQYHKLGQPVWQMIWLSFTSLLFFFPLAIWGGTFFYGLNEHTALERQYFFWMMLFGPSFPFYGALCGFFIGQGKIKIITLLAIGANIINCLLDIVLIFGVQGWIPPLGVTGAAIATCGSQIFQALVLFAIFMNKPNREHLGTAVMRLNTKLLWNCFQVGSPAAIFAVMELLGWAVFYWLMTMMGIEYITIAGICQSILILLFFFIEGVNKGVTALTGNFIGANNLDIVHRVAKSGIILHLTFFLLVIGMLFIAFESISYLFLNHSELLVAHQLDSSLEICLYLTAVYILIEGIRMVYAGILTAGGDTLFLLFSGSIGIWILLVLPTYLIVVKGGASIEIAISLWIFYSGSTMLLNIWRTQHGKWRTIKLIHN